MKAVLITGRTLGQGLGLELGKFSDIYYRHVAVCEMNPDDMAKLGLSNGSLVNVKTRHGRVTLRAMKSSEELPKGVVFIPYGPWVSLLIESETHGTGMPTFKGIEVEVEPSNLSYAPRIEELVA